MMTPPDIPLDDILDIKDLVAKIEPFISDFLEDVDLHVALSALMSTTIRLVAVQCDTVEEMIFYRNLFFKGFDTYIRQTKLRNN